MKRFLCSLVLLSSVAIAGGGLSGKWSGSFDVTSSEGETHADSAYMVLKEKNGIIEGTAGPNQDKQWNIQNSKLEGGRLTFDVQADEGQLALAPCVVSKRKNAKTQRRKEEQDLRPAPSTTVIEAEPGFVPALTSTYLR